MKIAYFIGTLKKEDGVTRVLLALIEQGIKKGIDPVIVTGWAEDSSISPVPVIQVPSIIFPLYRDYRISLPNMRKFEKQLNKFEPDIIHLHSPDTIAWSALKYAKKYKIPIMATHHTDFCKYLAYYHLNFLKPFIWFLLKRLYNQMEIITTPSQVIAQGLISHRISNVKALPWGVNFKRFNKSFRSQALRKKLLKKGEKFILLCVSRLTWEKDLRTLAKAYNLLKQKRKDFIMAVVGDGPARKELESLMPRAIFFGHLGGIKLSEIYASSDIFVFPSTTETFGNVTLEAMASGLVPVVADAGGSKSLIQNHKNGFLTKPKNYQDIVIKTTILLDDNVLRRRMRKTALSFSKDFTWEKVFSKLLKIYQAIE